MANTTERVDRLEEALMKLAYAQFNTEMEIRDLKGEMLAFKNEMAEFKNEVRRDQKAMNKRWGEISNKMGTIVEDIIYPSVRRIAREHFGAPDDMEFEGQRIKRLRAAGDRREFDGVFAWPGHVLVLEAKATVRPEYLEAFDDFVRKGLFFAYFPEYEGRRLIPVFAALALTESEIDWLSAHHLYAVAMGEEAMELLNGEVVDAARRG
ncbi:MAG: hypothetical protein N2Z63_06785 [Thiobacillaceae bacterium]|nr:hypothetical protein [Thiobacillaceae bacterium]